MRSKKGGKYMVDGHKSRAYMKALKNAPIMEYMDACQRKSGSDWRDSLFP